MRAVTAGTHTWLAARVFLKQKSDDFSLLMTRVRRDFDPEDIHDLRVSSRRLREWLDVFSPCFRKRHIPKLRKELTALTKYLGSIRNSDEALSFFSQLAESSGEKEIRPLEEIVATLQAKRGLEQRELRQEVKRIAPASLLQRMDELFLDLRIFDPDSSALFRPVAETLFNAIAARGKPVMDTFPGALHESEIAAQHRLRIAIKCFRYRLEFMASFAMPHDYQEVYGIIKNYQELLGHMHDLDVFATTVDELLPGRPEAEAIRAAIGEQRHHLYSEFTSLSNISPFSLVISRVRSLI